MGMILSAVIILCMLAVMSACNRESVATVTENIRYQAGDMVQWSAMEDGIFYKNSDDHLVHFVSADTHEDIVFCANPVCKHEAASESNPDPECRAALFEEKAYIAYYEGCIYYFVNNGIFEHKLYKMDLSSGVRELIGEYPYKYSPLWYVFYEDCLYYNARIMEVEGATSSDNDVNATIPSFIRLRNQDDNNGSFEILDVIAPTNFSFKYKFAGSQKSETSKIKITLSSGTIVENIEFIVKHTEEYLEYNLNLTTYDFEKVNIKVEFIDEWSTDTYLDIDDVKACSNVSIDNTKEWIINNTPTSISKSVILPFTTEFGGIISWESSDSKVLSKEGIVNRPEQSKNITLTATITYLNKTEIVTIEIVVKGKESVEALEIYFIDIGKYGAGDCGECTYIKFCDVDIIVDAGDHFEATIQAINETINQKLEDDVIEYVIATHPDGDHIGGMAALFENYSIENLIKFEGEYTTQKYQKMKTAYINEGCKVYEIKSDIIDQNKGEKFITLSSDIFINFIDTSYYTSDESNGKSIVFTLEAYGTKVLMTGDADNATGHTDLELKYKDQVGNIDILKVVHHGTSNGTSMEFLNTVDPEVAIICNGNYLGNKHAHPHPTALKNLYTYDSNIKVYAITGGGTIDGVVNKSNNTYKCSSEDRFNQRNGLITVVIDNNGYTLNSEYYGDNILEINQTIYYQSIVANNLG